MSESPRLSPARPVRSQAEAWFGNAHLWGADLTGTDLNDADLREAEGLTADRGCGASEIPTWELIVASTLRTELSLLSWSSAEDIWSSER
ncbi:pentapeptide repeat-containing protein [Streptomyces sp. NPDC001903]|uniref:pentapeptide repeat-containing protein n=1 Tax=Streptomyces sp. NPDC001903 TaxID=3364622 RepID=UPI0036BCC40A